MPNCTLILSRHLGPSQSRLPPGSFAASALLPFVEGCMSNGHSLHVIHDRVPLHPLTNQLVTDFEKMVGSRKVLRHWKEIDRMWRNGAKKQMEAANRGIDSVLLNKAGSPEAAFLLDVNRERPFTIVNHVGFYPLEAAIENTRFRIAQEKANSCIKAGDMKGGVRLMMQANEAMASCNLLRDEEMVRQVGQLGCDSVALRGLSHMYLSRLDGLDIPIAQGSRKADNFANIVRKLGVALEVIAEPGDPAFSEEAICFLCSGGMEPQAHERLALLDIMFVSYMNMADAWECGGGFELGRSLAIRDYDGLVAEIYGGASPCPPISLINPEHD